MEISLPSRLGSRVCDRAKKIGFEYIVEAEGEGFVDKKLYFVCLLCSETKEHSELDSHLSSDDHRLKFLVIAEFASKIFIISFIFIERTLSFNYASCLGSRSNSKPGYFAQNR